MPNTLLDWRRFAVSFTATAPTTTLTFFNGSASNNYLSGLDNVSVVPVSSLPGDFDFDGDGDGRDFLIWQRNPAVGDLSDWQTNYGVGALTAASIAVPEPSAFGSLLLISLILAVSSRPAYISALTRCA